MRKLAILGNGPDAAFAAALLAANLGEAFEISWHRAGEDEADETVVRTNPAIRSLLHALGVDEKELIKAGACPLLGSAIALPDRPPLFLGHADMPATIGGLPFYQALLVARGSDCPPAPQHYNIAALMAGQNRFTPPSGDPNSIHGLYSYGFAVPAKAWSEIFAARAEAAGAVIADGEKDADFIVDLRPTNGEKGWKRFASQPVAVEWQDYDAPSASPYIFCKVGDDALETIYRLPGTARKCVTVPVNSGRTFGRRETIWDGNRIYMGAAAAIMPGLLPHDFQLLARQLIRFVDFAPASAEATEEAREYNRRISEDIDRAFDSEAVLLPESFKPTTSEELARKNELFTYRGRMSLDEGEVLSEDEWITLMDFVHGGPEAGDLRAARLPKPQLAELLRRLRGDVAAVASNAPPIEDALKRLAS